MYWNCIADNYFSHILRLVGDGPEEASAAAAMGWPFLRIALKDEPRAGAIPKGVMLTGLTMQDVARRLLGIRDGAPLMD